MDSKIVGSEYINANYIRAVFESDVNNINSSSESLNSISLCQPCISSQKKGSQNLQSGNKNKNVTMKNCGNCNKRSELPGHSSMGLGNNFGLYENEQFKTYIATQGCLQSTIIDFWNMIWQENTRVIVMTTKEIERGKNKCAKYWPDLRQSKDFDDAKVTCINESVQNDYTLREFDFSWKNKEERRIYHYHFQVWPDHGVPSDPGCVLNFLQDVNTRQNQLKASGDQPVSMKRALKNNKLMTDFEQINIYDIRNPCPNYQINRYQRLGNMFLKRLVFPV